VVLVHQLLKPQELLGAIRNMIGKAESGGDYNVMVGGKKGDLTNMTLAQILEQQSKMTQRGSGFESSALGKYQITRCNSDGSYQQNWHGYQHHQV
jgi:hypothetical protein